jgi:hypothetical protein
VIARRRGEAGRTHGGWVIVVAVDHAEFGVILEVFSRELTVRPRQS